MATIREQILDGLVARLNAAPLTGLPTTERTRLAQYGRAELPAINIFPSSSTPEIVGRPSGPIVKAALRVVVELRAAGADSPTPTRPDEALDPIYAHVIKRLAGYRVPDGSGGFLTHDVEEESLNFSYEQGEVPYVLGSLILSANYQYLRTDPERRV